MPSLWLWFPVRFVLSSGSNGLFVATEFWINRLADENNRGRYIALYAICLAGSFGVGPGVLQIIGTHGIAPFAAGAADAAGRRSSRSCWRGATAPRIEEGEQGSVFSVLKLAPAAFAAAAVFGAIDAGMAGAASRLCRAPGLYRGACRACRHGHRRRRRSCSSIRSAGSPTAWTGASCSRICAASGVIGAALTPFAVGTPTLFYALLLVWGGVILGIYSVGLTLLGERFKGASLANANAAFVMAYCMGLLAGPALEGAGLQLWNPHGLVAVLGAICAAYLAFLLLRRPVQPKKPPAPAP